MAALARGHADAIREGFAGEPVDVLGVSTGGSIAQQLAARVAELLRTGATRPPAGRQERAWCRAR
jgi:pimeloyl-ACP methyl ester carboxylesterase